MTEEYIPTTIFGKRAVERLEPWLTPDLARYVDSVGEVFQRILELAEEEGNQGEAGWKPGWEKLLNPATCPSYALNYLAQFVGVELPITATEAEARALIKEETGLERGTLAVIEAACRRIHGKTTFFTIEERTNAAGEERAYCFNVLIKKGTSATIKAELKVAIEKIKPGGVLFNIIEVENAWIEGEKAWDEVAAGKKWSTIKEGEY